MTLIRSFFPQISALFSNFSAGETFCRHDIIQFFVFTLLSVRNFKFSVLTTQLKENNLKQSVIHMNNISEILLNIIFRKYVSVSYGLEKKLTFSSITKSQFSYCRLVWMFSVEHRTTWLTNYPNHKPP